MWWGDCLVVGTVQVILIGITEGFNIVGPDHVCPKQELKEWEDGPSSQFYLPNSMAGWPNLIYIQNHNFKGIQEMSFLAIQTYNTRKAFPKD